MYKKSCKMFYRIPFIHFVTVSPCILYFKSKSIMKTGRNKGGGGKRRGVVEKDTVLEDRESFYLVPCKRNSIRGTKLSEKKEKK